MRVCVRICVVLACLLAVQATAWAQATVAGVVKDSSGAVLPGVTVEAASPALIEKVRTVVTDGEGRYNVVDLRPGAYTVTFTLTGFRTVRREGVELPAGFTATVNAGMEVGALEETVVVTGGTPLVDTANVRQQKVISNELLAALPTSSRSLSTLITLTPGMTGNADVGGATGIYYSNAPRINTFHGKGGVKFTYDGMQANNFGSVGSTSYVINPATAEETTVDTGGVSAESGASGVGINMIPKEGSNSVKLFGSVMYTNNHLQSDNLTDALRSRGLATNSQALYLYDGNLTVGGPLRKDRLWFFLASRFSGNKNQVPGVFFNQTQGTPFYTPDPDRPSFRREWLRSQGARLTWQASEKNKVNVFTDVQGFFVRGTGTFAAPEALASCWSFWPQGLFQATWSSPRTNKLLLEAGTSVMVGPYPCRLGAELDLGGGINAVRPGDISILESSTTFRYNAASIYSNRLDNTRLVQRFSVSYVTGSHAFKIGVQQQEGIANTQQEVNGDINYVLLRGVPNQVVQFATPYLRRERMRADLGIYAQDQWVIKRLTLNYGLRFDYFNSGVPAQEVAAGRFAPARDFGAVECVPCWKDLNPRVGASYDLFGDGRTALKVSMGRYVSVTGTDIAALNNPIATSVNSATRTWNDANNNYLPDCDLTNLTANRECGPISNTNFGRPNITTVWAPDVITGFRHRPYNWDFATEVQRQLGTGVSLTGGYYHNSTGNYRVTDNLAVTPSDYTPYCITAPVDPRLPNGGGYPVCGLYDINPAKFGQVNNVVTQASHYYGDQTHVSCGAQPTAAGGFGTAGVTGVACGQSNFFALSINTRLRSGAQFSAGVDTGRTVIDSCFTVDSPQDLLNCHIVTPFKATTQFKLFWSYPVPLPGDIVLSGTLQNLAGPPITADYQAPNSLIAPSLGRDLAACRGQAVCVASATVPLIAPMTQFEDRRTQLDMRVSKIFRFAGKRLTANVDLYNLLNASSILWVNGTYGSTWLRPVGNSAAGAVTAILPARMVQFSGQFSF